MRKKPSLCFHKGVGQWYVRLGGKIRYLGGNKAEAADAYDDAIADWMRGRDPHRLTVDELALLFLAFADDHYRRPDGTPSGALGNARDALKYAVRAHGTTRCREFGPRALKACRDAMIADGRCRTNINRLVHWIRRAFAWAVEEELVKPETLIGLRTVRALQAGRTKAVESKPIEAVPEGTVNDTLEHLPRVVADMVRLQLLTGARPGEVCAMRPCDVTITTAGPWCYRPPQHKTAHKGKERRIYVGPKGQVVLRPYLDRDSEAHCFSPAESEAQRNEDRRRNRQTPMTPSQAARKPKRSRRRQPRDQYTKDTYARAIKRGCELAGVLPWSPNQLRHSRATILRERFGIEAAQVVLGHGDTRTTEIYAERDFATAARIMAEIG